MNGQSLIVQDVNAERAGAEVVRGLSLQLEPGEVVALLGPNGAGKSTSIDAICGMAKKTNGSVHFGEQDITNSQPHQIARMGLLQVAQERELFPEMTVEENIAMGALAARGRTADTKRIVADVKELFPILGERWSQLAGSMSGGQQQMLAIGRALAGSPAALLLDEPSSGLAPVIVQEMVSSLVTLAGRGMTLLLVEQNVAVALKVATRVIVMRRGEVTFSGEVHELGSDPRQKISEMYV